VRDFPDYSVDDGNEQEHPYLLFIFAFNEGERLKSQFSKLPSPDARKYDIMLGDDGSTDGSTPESLIETHRLRGILRLEKNHGLSPVIKAGMDWYLEQNYKGVILINGNDRDSVDSVPDFIEAMEAGSHYVQGSRFMPGGRHKNTPGYRDMAIRWVHAPFFSLAAGQRFTDTTNGYRAFTTHALAKMGDGLFSDRFQHYEVEQYMAWKTVNLGLKAEEIPVERSYPEDTASKPYSKIRPGVGWFHMIAPLVNLLFRRYP